LLPARATSEHPSRSGTGRRARFTGPRFGYPTAIRTTSYPPRVGGYAPIGEYAAIGDGRTLALVARDGSVDWLPLPTLDSPTVFAALLDAGRGGRFVLEPEGEHTARRRYVPRTNVLETTFTAAEGTLRVTDALTLQDGSLLPWLELARRVECTAGSVRVRWRLEPRFGYGLDETTIEEIDGVPVASAGRRMLAVHAWGLGTPRCSNGSIAGAADLAKGESGLIACIGVEDEPLPHPTRDEVETRLSGTVAGWRRWLRAHEYDGPWRAQVERSALALELLIHVPSGAIAAAGTTGLPERIGGDRNYDYRFAWVRDSSFTLDALSTLGYREQVQASLSWLLRATEPTHPRMQPLYSLAGSVPRSQQTLPLEGYRGSQPVERGNAAARQLQLGNYGDLFGTVWHYVEHGNALDRGTGVRLAEVADLVCAIWKNADSGIWELPEQRRYTISKMSCWSALTRAAELAARGQVPGDHAQRWLATADEVRDFVERRCWSDAHGAFSFYADTDSLDCGVLLASQLEFDDPRGERMNGTIDALLRELRAEGPLLYRYTGMQTEEGAFLPCSFWMVSALAKAGRLDEARSLMDELLALGNDVGLWAEELDPSTHEQLGNYPLALTHLSLIRAAAMLRG
jgi:pentatricopeptide repeat protein